MATNTQAVQTLQQKAVMACATRRLKNARYLREVAPQLMPAGSGGVVPADVIAQLHRRDRSAQASTQVEAVLSNLQMPTVRPAISGPLFRGNFVFAKIRFFVTALSTTFQISDADMTMAIRYATLASVPISKYAAQYGYNLVHVVQTPITFDATLPESIYTDGDVRGWVNTIAAQNGLPANTCIVILNPREMDNRDAERGAGYQGYHLLGNVPYAFVNVYGSNFTLADANDSYAQILSHEIAEAVVDPFANVSNPEVCDACGPNCQTVRLDFFDANSAYVATQTVPPPAGFAFKINAIAKPSSATSCPAPSIGCDYAPPAVSPSDSPEIAAASWGPNRLDIFGLGQNNEMLHKAWDGSEWRPSETDWEQLGGVFNSPPSAVSWSANRLDIFALGTDDQMFHKAWDGQAWRPSNVDWEALGGTFSSPAATLAWAPNRLDIFASGAAYDMSHKWWDGSAWQPSPAGWEAHPGLLISPVSGAAWSANRLDLFALGSDSQVYHRWWSGQWWPIIIGWEPLGGSFMSPPVVVSWGNNRLDSFAVGTDRVMYHKYWDGSMWGPSKSDWESLGGMFNSPPAAVSWSAGRLDIFGLGLDNQMFHKWWQGSWGPSDTGWEPLGGTFTSPPAVASWGVNRLDIFGLGLDRQMFHKAWDGSSWRPSIAGWEPLGGNFNTP